MSALPERYQRYAQPTGQRPVYPAAVYHPQPIEVYEDRTPRAYVADLDDPTRFVAVDARLIQRPEPPAPRDVAPQPLFDPAAQRLFAGGLGIGAAGAGLGFGFGQLAAGIALMGTSGVAILLGLLLAAGMRGGGSVHVRQEVHNHARWFGRNTTNL